MSKEKKEKSNEAKPTVKPKHVDTVREFARVLRGEHPDYRGEAKRKGEEFLEKVKLDPGNAAELADSIMFHGPELAKDQGLSRQDLTAAAIKLREGLTNAEIVYNGHAMAVPTLSGHFLQVGGARFTKYPAGGFWFITGGVNRPCQRLVFVADVGLDEVSRAYEVFGHDENRGVFVLPLDRGEPIGVSATVLWDSEQVEP